MAIQQRMEDLVTYAGRDKYGNTCYQYPGGKRYCGKNAKQRAMKQGYAKKSAIKKLLDGKT